MDRKIKIVVLLLGLALASAPSNFVNGQTCSDCGNPRTYSSTANLNVGLNASNWSGPGSFSGGTVARFSDPRNYIWTANDFILGGIILRGGANLTLNRPNQGNNPSFTISNNCIVVGSGSTLNLIYITALENVIICIEEGGTLIMDSRSSSRNDFFLDNVQINLQGPGAQLDFGDANIVVGSGGIIIDGYVGDGCDDPDGNVRSTNPPVSGDDVCLLFEISALPVEYLYFDASFTRQERLVELKWATGKEWENSHFEVERAVNDVKNWETIGRVEGQGYSGGPVEYQFKDKDVPLVGGNAFYRLRQVDFNGQYAYSEVVSARIPALEITNGVWRAFPNPTDGNHFKVSLMDNSQYHEEEIVFRLVHPMVYTAPQQVASEWEMNAAIQETVRKMPKGVFVVEIQWGRKVEHIKVIKK